MNILNKIEEIRQKPEKIRQRYVQVAVFVSMIMILAVWLLSFGLYGKKEKDGSFLDFSRNEKIEELKKQKQSIEETTRNLKNITDEFDESASDINREGFQENPK